MAAQTSGVSNSSATVLGLTLPCLCRLGAAGCTGVADKNSRGTLERDVGYY